MKNRRINYILTEDESRRIDILKVWLALMVVFIHSYSECMDFTTGSIQLDVPTWLHIVKYVVSQSISRCAVPAFFAISAILLYRKEFTWKDNLKKKFKTLVIPYLLLNTFWICFLWLVQQIEWVKTFFPDASLVISEWDIFDFINAYIGYTGYPLLYPLWFIRDLFVLNILAKLIKNVIDKFPMIIMCLLLIMWMFSVPTGVFCIGTQAICFFSFGYYIVKYDIRISVVDNIYKPIIVICYLVLIALDVMTRGSGIFNGIIHQLCILVGICFWYRCATKIDSTTWNKKLLIVSKYSFFVYIFHEMCLTVLKKLGMVFLPLTPFFQVVQYFAIPIVIFGCCIIAGMLLEKYMPKVYFLLTGKTGDNNLKYRSLAKD